MNLLQKSFLKIRKVEMPGFEEPFYLKELSGGTLAKFRNTCIDEKGELFKLDDVSKMAYLICLCNCDEKGNLQQTVDDYPLIAENLPHNVLAELVSKIYDVSDVDGNNAKKS